MAEPNHVESSLSFPDWLLGQRIDESDVPKTGPSKRKAPPRRGFPGLDFGPWSPEGGFTEIVIAQRGPGARVPVAKAANRRRRPRIKKERSARRSEPPGNGR